VTTSAVFIFGLLFGRLIIFLGVAPGIEELPLIYPIGPLTGFAVIGADFPLGGFVAQTVA
jgi:hypothetical protein